MKNEKSSVQRRLKKNSKLNEETGCIEWEKNLLHGYGQTGVKEEGGWKTRRAHRVAYKEYVGEIPAGMLVCHTCDNRKCINPKHLFLGTHQDNADDRVAKGRGRCGIGERHSRAKLTEEQVILIRQLRSYGFTRKKIAEGFGVTTVTIGEIANRKKWKHVK